MKDTVTMLLEALWDCVTALERTQHYTEADRLKAADKARAALSAAKGGGWISVSDRLPEKNIEVLVAFEGITIPSTGQYTGNPRDVNGWSYPHENMGSTDQGTDPIVTAWQPLPPPPKD